MASADTRRGLAALRTTARDRKRRQRAAAKEAAAPRQEIVDRAIVASLREMIYGRYGSVRAVPPDSDIHRLIKGAAEILREDGYATRSPRMRVLWARALGAI